MDKENIQEDIYYFLEEGLVNYGLKVKLGLLVVFVNKVLLEYRYVYLFQYYLRLFLCCND